MLHSVLHRLCDKHMNIPPYSCSISLIMMLQYILLSFEKRNSCLQTVHSTIVKESNTHVLLQRFTVDEARFGVHKRPRGGRVLVAGGENLQNVGKLSGVRRHRLKESCEWRTKPSEHNYILSHSSSEHRLRLSKNKIEFRILVEFFVAFEF